jgi:photosystem II stability/assembly factor-like uncharacterized protein
MHKKIILTGLIIISGLGVIVKFFLSGDDPLYTSSGQFSRPELYLGEYMAHQRSFPHGRINHEFYLREMKKAGSSYNSEKWFDYTWEPVGPTNIGGRITDIAVHPDSPATIYLGAATGGVWKTTDNGNSWSYAFNGADLISIGDLAIDPSNENVLYTGTGEANASSYSFLGNGIYKSNDAGVSWTHIGLEYSAYIGRIVVDYNNSERIFATACGNLFTPSPDRGVYRSSDGGASWENILFVNDTTAAIDLVQHPTNPDILFAAMWERSRGLEYRHSFGEGTGLWKTTDGGDSWFELTNGLITNENAGRIGLDIALSNPDVMYAYYDLPDYEVAVFKSSNGGTSWTQTNDQNLQGMNSNFGWYFGQIRIHPENENIVFVMGVGLYLTTNGGNSWSEAGGWDIHVDHHAMYFDLENERIIEGNDGGLYTSTNNGSNWTKINNLPFTQFYAIDVDYQNPERIIGGTQDNNTIITNSGGAGSWYPILGGDGMYCLIDYTDPDILYSEYQWGYLHKSYDGGNNMEYIGWQWEGERVNWSAPLAMDPVNHNILYFGTYHVWKSLDGGMNWNIVSGDLTSGVNQYFHTITTISISSLNENIIIAGTGDGFIHVSTDAGSTWENISSGIPERWVTKVVADPFNENTIYATISGFRWDEPLSHVFISNNLGQTWQSISGNLPEIPVNDLLADPDHQGYLFIGTDAGVYFTNDGGITWYSLNQGINNVPVVAMKIHNPTRTLVAGTYGLSAFRLNLDDLITSINSLKQMEKAFTINPNPFTEKITITGGGSAEIAVKILNCSGKEVGRIISSGEKDLSFLPQGIYFLNIEDEMGNAIQYEKIIKL